MSGGAERIKLNFRTSYDRIRLIEWIKNFLTDHKQTVRVNGKFSCWAKVFSGIPQGSLLGQHLFIIFINDLVDFCDINLKLYLFADDDKLYCHIQDMLDIDYLQRGIDNFVYCLQCFDAVGWAVGRASSL